MSEKIFIGSVKSETIQGQTGPWEAIRIALGPQDFEKLEQHKNAKGWINLDFKKGQSGNYYMEVNTWVPKNVYQQHGCNSNYEPGPQQEFTPSSGNSIPPAPEDDLPF